MKKITPHLWFDKEAKEAAELYTSLFPNSKINHVQTIKNTPSGDCDIVAFQIADQPFMAINAGPVFKINPSISFILNFDPSKMPDAEGKLRTIWNKLTEGGKVLMELSGYPFSKLYGWIEDKYGVSWQLMLTNPDGEERPFVIPAMMFTGDMTGKAEEAIDFYIETFKKSPLPQAETPRRGITARYPAGMEPDKESTIMFADFNILNTWMAAMDSGRMHDFKFNEAVSLLVPCDTQEEIDYLWKEMSADPESEQCGWLKDKYGVSWQIWPTALAEMMETGTPEQIDRLTQAFLQMKKYDIAKLREAFEGNK
jgi:predicted 3-demethylubiquinone-9 3-methyltransferase (glyoxalase superfamily)